MNYIPMLSSITVLVIISNQLVESKEFCQAFRDNNNSIGYVFKRNDFEFEVITESDIIIDGLYWRINFSYFGPEAIQFVDPNRESKSSSFFSGMYSMALCFGSGNGNCIPYLFKKTDWKQVAVGNVTQFQGQSTPELSTYGLNYTFTLESENGFPSEPKLVFNTLVSWLSMVFVTNQLPDKYLEVYELKSSRLKKFDPTNVDFLSFFKCLEVFNSDKFKYPGQLIGVFKQKWEQPYLLGYVALFQINLKIVYCFLPDSNYTSIWEKCQTYPYLLVDCSTTTKPTPIQSEKPEPPKEFCQAFRDNNNSIGYVFRRNDFEQITETDIIINGHYWRLNYSFSSVDVIQFADPSRQSKYSTLFSGIYSMAVCSLQTNNTGCVPHLFNKNDWKQVVTGNVTQFQGKSTPELSIYGPKESFTLRYRSYLPSKPKLVFNPLISSNIIAVVTDPLPDIGLDVFTLDNSSVVRLNDSSKTSLTHLKVFNIKDIEYPGKLVGVFAQKRPYYETVGFVALFQIDFKIVWCFLTENTILRNCVNNPKLLVDCIPTTTLSTPSTLTTPTTPISMATTEEPPKKVDTWLDIYVLILISLITAFIVIFSFIGVTFIGTKLRDSKRRM